MKRRISILILICLTLSPLQAGFFSSVLGGVTANTITGSGSSSSVVSVSKIEKRMDNINTYLWHLHEKKSYDESYKVYLDILEKHIEKSQYDDLRRLDTIAWVYKDNGNQEKAVEIYETRILPWVKIKFKSRSFRNKYEKNYKKIANLDTNHTVEYNMIHPIIETDKKVENVEETPSVVYAVWGIFSILFIILVWNIIGVIEKRKSRNRTEEKE